MTNKIIKIKKCRVCASGRIKIFFDLGKHSLANRLLKRSGEKEEKYPLSLSFCKECSLVQLNHTVSPKKLFSKYLWVTGTSKGANIFASEFCEQILSKQKFSKKSFVFEAASNDGTFLIPFQKKGFRVLGADPAKNIVDMARKNGIPTEVMFFGANTAKRIVSRYGKADIVFARNVLAHVENTADFIQGLREVLSDDGVLAVEVHYGGDILSGLQYDSIYHEHLCYFTLRSIERALNESDLYVFDVSLGPISGGALIVYAKKKIVPESENLKKHRRREDAGRMNNLQTWEKFAGLAHVHRNKLRALINAQTANGLRIAGYGASARSSTLLNFCGLGHNEIIAIADNNKLKQDMFAAGSHIPIYSAEKTLSLNPDIIFLLAWNFKDEIIRSLKGTFKYSGDYIVPLPNKPSIIKK